MPGQRRLATCETPARSRAEEEQRRAGPAVAPRVDDLVLVVEVPREVPRDDEAGGDTRDAVREVGHLSSTSVSVEARWHHLPVGARGHVLRLGHEHGGGVLGHLDGPRDAVASELERCEQDPGRAKHDVLDAGSGEVARTMDDASVASRRVVPPHLVQHPPPRRLGNTAYVVGVRVVIASIIASA